MFLIYRLQLGILNDFIYPIVLIFLTTFIFIHSHKSVRGVVDLNY